MKDLKHLIQVLTEAGLNKGDLFSMILPDLIIRKRLRKNLIRINFLISEKE